MALIAFHPWRKLSRKVATAFAVPGLFMPTKSVSILSNICKSFARIAPSSFAMRSKSSTKESSSASIRAVFSSVGAFRNANSFQVIP